jgi:tRNA-2-methylthio-N6-dimethylallyladenosine synthase
LTEVQSLQKEITIERNRELLGRTMEVLVEGRSGKDPGRLTARTRGNKIVHFEGADSLTGALLKVKVFRAGFVALEGKIASDNGGS